MGGIPTRWSETLPAHSSSSACGTESARIADNLDYVILGKKVVALEANTYTVNVHRQCRASASLLVGADVLIMESANMLAL